MIITQLSVIYSPNYDLLKNTKKCFNLSSRFKKLRNAFSEFCALSSNLRPNITSE